MKYSKLKYLAKEGFRKILIPYGTRIINKYLHGPSGSETQTLTANKRIMRDESDSSSYGKITVYSVLNKNVPYNVAKVKHQVMEGRSGIASNDGGVQVPVTILCNHSKSQMTTQTATALVDVYTGQAPPFNLLVDLNNSGGAFVPQDFTDSRKNAQMFCRYMDYRIDFTNCDNTGTSATLYLVTPKVATDLDPVADWSTMDDETNYGGVIEANPPSGGASTQATVGALTYFHPYAKFYANKKIQAKWKILGLKEFQMGPGASRQVHWKVKVNKVMNYQYIEESPNLFHPNQTLFFILVTNGSTVVVNSVPLVPGASTSPCRTAWTSQVTATYSPMKITKEYPYKLGFNRQPFGAPAATSTIVSDLVTSIVNQS